MTATGEPVSDAKIECKIDGALTHSIQVHIKRSPALIEAGWSIDRYIKEFPGEPVLSPFAQSRLALAQAKEAEKVTAEVSDRKEMARLFDLPPAKAKNGRGEPIMIRFNEDLTSETKLYVPDIDKDYVFNIEVLKSVLIGYEMNKNILLHGLHGSGKTTMLEQAAARTNRPFLRLQHTINTEESHILGQWTVLAGETVFQLGPLPLAMMLGLVYCADEYDFALPSVTSVYQPVLEHKALMIKDAPPDMRIIRPHPNFRFVATGNTNGGGDDTGLYAGTQIQNAANYSRFEITEEIDYPDENVEVTIISGKSGCRIEEAKKFVQVATEIRKSFRGGQISSTLSPRELINAALLGLVKGGDWRGGLALAFMNRLSRTDREVCNQFAQRVFG
jgi:cobaltochelatase CobS